MTVWANVDDDHNARFIKVPKPLLHALQNGLITRHQLRLLEKTETRRATATKWKVKPGLFNDLGIGRMHTFGGYARPQGFQGGALTCNRDLLDPRLLFIGNVTYPKCAIKSQLEAVKIGHPAKTQKHRLPAAHDAG